MSKYVGDATAFSYMNYIMQYYLQNRYAAAR